MTWKQAGFWLECIASEVSVHEEAPEQPSLEDFARILSLNNKGKEKVGKS